MMPSPDAFVDLKTFDTPEKLAARLHAIATDQAAYDEVHAWRYRHPSEWSEGFRSLLRVMSTDIKYGVCDVLRKGADAVPASAAQADCDYSATAMGRTVGAWPDHGGIRDPLEHLNKKCEHATAECWEFKHPEVYERWANRAWHTKAGRTRRRAPRRVGSSAGDVERRERKRRVEVFVFVETIEHAHVTMRSYAHRARAEPGRERERERERGVHGERAAQRESGAASRDGARQKRRDAEMVQRHGRGGGEARGLQRSHRDVRVGGALRQRSGARSAARERREREHRERQGVPPRALRAGGGG